MVGKKAGHVFVSLLDSWEKYQIIIFRKHMTRFTIDDFAIILYMKTKTPQGLSNKDEMLAPLDVYIARHKSLLSGRRRRWDQKIILPGYMCLASWPILYKCH